MVKVKGKLNALLFGAVVKKKALALIIGTILLIEGLLFVSFNFISPHTVVITVYSQEKPNFYTLASMDSFHLNGYPPETLEQSADYIYRSIPIVNISKGQTLMVSWYADLFLDVFIFSADQFVNFQSILPHMQAREGNQTWEKTNGITYEAMGNNKHGNLLYNVTKTGNYVAVITNAGWGAAYASVTEFQVEVVAYRQKTNYTTQTDSLYLYLGTVSMITGIIVFVAILRHRKT